MAGGGVRLFSIYAAPHARSADRRFAVIVWTLRPGGRIDRGPCSFAHTYWLARLRLPEGTAYCLAREPGDAPGLVESWV